MSKREMTKFILPVIIFIAFYFPSSAQQYTWQDKLNWQIITKNSKTIHDHLKILSFDGAVFQGLTPGLPIYYKNIPIDLAGDAKVEMTEAIYSPVENDSLLAFMPLNNNIQIHNSVVFGALKPYLHVDFCPFRRNPVTATPEKLEKFKLIIRIDPDIIAPAGSSMTKKAESSKLASGDWFKIGVTETGIYKMDYAQLSSMGLNVKSIPVSYLKVYGRPGGMLPQQNSVKRDSDLVENAIYVGDNNGNGIFEQGDYILFYAKGPHVWTYNSGSKHFEHQLNIYSDTAYYFVTASSEPGKRINSLPSETGAPDAVITGFDDYGFHELDQLTDITKYVKSGREWFGEEFRSLSGNSITKSFDFNFPLMDFSQPASIKTHLLARTGKPSQFNVYVNGAEVQTVIVPAADVDNYLGTYAGDRESTADFQPTNGHLSVQLEYLKPNADAIGWLDYIEMNVRGRLDYAPGQYGFRDAASVGAGKINEYRMSGANQNVKIWDVTDFHNVRLQQTELSGSTLSFKAKADTLREYVAFDGNGYFTPKVFGRVQNQDLHGIEGADMVILAHPDFLAAANRLAQFHRDHDNFNVIVVTPQQVYNEFSSGGQDVSAIRDFMKMFYDRAKLSGGKYPGYLLLFGDASYDYKNRTSINTNFVPSYESFESLVPWGSFIGDGYFGFLDDNEGWKDDGSTNDLLDISIGRLPVDNASQAEDMVNKIIRYHDKQSMGDWRNILSFIADDPDMDNTPVNTHFDQTEGLVKELQGKYPSFNVEKIYLDAFKQISTSAGPRYPDVNKAINLRMEEGTLILNYVGHGAEVGAAHERVITIDDINSWKNAYKMPLLITATCELSRFDDPDRTSAGELALLNPNGGAIALYTTTRVVNSGGNEVLNRNILIDNLLKRVNGKPQRFGDAFRDGQNRTGDDGNTRSFTLLGDPAVRIALPEKDVVVTEINQKPAGAGDTLKALSLVTIKGEVRSGGLKMSDFNGTVYPTVYDKKATRYTLANEGVFKVPFKVQDNIIYKGKASVTNGDYTFSFYVPKDISFSYGYGKLSFYAENGILDAGGYDSDVVIGGSVNNPTTDDQGPKIRLFMNDTFFKSGGLVDNNPVLIAKLSDDIGINTIGSGIGHDLIGTLNADKKIVLNNYYQSDLDNFRAGTIVYPFKDLADGKYTLSVKAWDVSNNSAEASIDFVVASSSKLVLDKIFNYPNPFYDKTTFQFEHNRPNEDLQVSIDIYTLSGQVVKQIRATVNTEGNRVTSIQWDGKNDSSNDVAQGIYVYRLTVRTNDGQVAQQSQKLVVIK